MVVFSHFFLVFGKTLLPLFESLSLHEELLELELELDSEEESEAMTLR